MMLLYLPVCMYVVIGQFSVLNFTLRKVIIVCLNWNILPFFEPTDNMTVHTVSYRISFFAPRIYGLHPSLRKRRKKIALAQSKFASNVSRISSKPRKSYDFINSSCFSSFFKPWLPKTCLKPSSYTSRATQLPRKVLWVVSRSRFLHLKISGKSMKKSQ